MSEPTQNRLRETADRLDEIMEVSSPWVHAKLTPMLRDAADVIEGLETENAKLQKQAARLFDKTLELATKNAKLQEENARLRSCLSDDAENARMIMGENAELRELCADLYAEMITYSDAPNYNASVWAPKLRELGIEVNA